MPSTRFSILFVLLLSVPACAVGQTLAPWDDVGMEGLTLLQDYIRIDTSIPPGTTLPAARFLQQYLQKNGIASRIYESVPGQKANLLARLKGSGAGRPILLLHHTDVVPADKARWPVDPFGAVVREGYLWGRGAVDMKGLGVMHLMAFLELKRRQIPLHRDILLLAVTDEEVGGQLGARYMIERHYAELDPEYVFDEGGFGSRDILSEHRTVFGISVAEKKILWLRVWAEGTAGHGSQPHDQNPNQILVAALSRILARPDAPQSVPVLDVLRQRIGALAVNKFTNAIQRSTISLTSLRAGVGDPPKANVIPSLAEATLDCRLLPTESIDEFLAGLKRAAADDRVRFEIVYRMDDAPVSPWDTEVFRRIEQVLLRSVPGSIVSPMLIPYGTDSNQFRVKGAISYGLLPALVTRNEVNSMHSDSERIATVELTRGIRVFYEILEAIAARD